MRYQTEMSKVRVVLLILLILGFLVARWVILPHYFSVKEVGEAQVEVPADEQGYASSHIVQKGETLESIFSANGVLPRQGYDLITELRKVSNLRRLQIGDEIRLTFNEAGVLIAYNYFASPVDIYEAKRVGDSYEVNKLDIPIEIKVSRVSVELKSSLYTAFLGAGETPELIEKLVDIFAWDIDFHYDPRKDDTVSVIVEKYFVDGEFYKYGRIVSAEYDGKQVDQLAFYFEDGKGDGGYYDQDGNSLARNFLKSPVKYSRISSRFGRRLHPVTHSLHNHVGTDYAAPTGSPVWAMADGVVIKKGYGQYNGNYVSIRHSKGYVTQYLHLSRFQPGIGVGKRVRQKDLIGYVGTTGRSTGPHLHLGMIRNGKYIDALKLKKVKESKLAGIDMDRFKSELPARTAELRGEDHQLIGLPEVF